MIIQKLTPSPGRIAVVREYKNDWGMTTDPETGQQYKVTPETAALFLKGTPGEKEIDYQQQVNPWAMVVGVGPPETLRDGSLLTTEYETGDKVLVDFTGRTVEMETCDGQKDFIYVAAFSAVLGRLDWKCDSCGEMGKGERPDECPSCPKIIAPTAGQVSAVTVGSVSGIR